MKVQRVATAIAAWLLVVVGVTSVAEWAIDSAGRRVGMVTIVPTRVPTSADPPGDRAPADGAAMRAAPAQVALDPSGAASADRVSRSGRPATVLRSDHLTPVSNPIPATPPATGSESAGSGSVGSGSAGSGSAGRLSSRMFVADGGELVLTCSFTQVVDWRAVSWGGSRVAGSLSAPTEVTVVFIEDPAVEAVTGRCQGGQPTVEVHRLDGRPRRNAGVGRRFGA